MSKIKNKVYDWKERLRKGKMLTLTITLISIIIILSVYSFYKSKQYRQLSENSYNQSFYELIEYVNNTEKLLAKSVISKDSAHASQILSSIWRTATLAQNAMSNIPISPEKLENPQKFLNQVGDYCFVLSKKTTNNIDLTQEEINNLNNLHTYSKTLQNTLNQLESDLYSNNIKWGALTKEGNKLIASEMDDITKSSFQNIEEDLHQYTGLIYDGAFSENQQQFKGKGLTGEEITKEQATEVANKIIGKDKIINLEAVEEVKVTNLETFQFSFNLNNSTKTTIAVTKLGGHLLSMNNNRNVENVAIENSIAIQKGKEYLNATEFKNMKETYYMEEGNTITVNYAYTQKAENGEEIIIYPDLVKVKIALDNGEVLGIESKNYLNSHQEKREIPSIKIKKEDSTKKLNPNLKTDNINLSIIPTEAQTEILCYEIKGKAYENDFLVYVNAQTGKEEDILMVVNTPNGVMVS